MTILPLKSNNKNLNFSRIGFLLIPSDLLCFVIAVLSALYVNISAAEVNFPTHPVTMIVAFPPAGGTDIVARKVGLELSKLWRQPVIIDNKAGAGGTMGTIAAARAESSGHTIFMATLGNLAINQYLYSMDINPAQDFSPITNAVGLTFVLVANPNFAPNTVQELIAIGREKPDQFNYSSSGSGGAPHLAVELFKKMTGTKFIHVPYKGSAPSINDLLTGQVQFTMDSLAQALPHIQSGKLKALAVLGSKRSPLLPNVPTIAESGVPGYEFSNWFGIVAPANTPKEIVQKIYVDISKVLKQQEMVDQLSKMGVEVIDNTPQQFSEQIRAEALKWAEIVKEGKITK